MAPRTRPRHTVVLATLVVACFAFGLQQTMVVPALPSIQRDLGTTAAWGTWVLTAFLLVSSIAIPLLGRLGDQLGKHRILLLSLVLFLAGSIGCALAPDIWSLIACRAVQGIGGGIWPLSFSIVKDELPRERVAIGLAFVSGVAGGAGGLGLVVAGVIVDGSSWRWMFAAAAVPIAVALALVIRFVPPSPIRAGSRVDFRGAALLAAALVCLLLGLTEAASWGWTSGRILGLFAAAATAFAAWLRVEARTAEPMVDIGMLRHRVVLVTNVVTLLQGFAMTSTFVLLTNFVQMPRGLDDAQARLVDFGFGASGTRAGLILLPGAVVNLVLGPFQGQLVHRIGARTPFAAGMALSALAVVLIALFHEEPWQVAAAMTLFGAGVGFAFVAIPNLITSSVRPTETGVATAMNFVMRTVGGVVGAQVGAALLLTHRIAGTEIPSEKGYLLAFWTAAAVALVATPLAALARPARSARDAAGPAGTPAPIPPGPLA